MPSMLSDLPEDVENVIRERSEPASSNEAFQKDHNVGRTKRNVDPRISQAKPSFELIDCQCARFDGWKQNVAPGVYFKLS